MDLDCLINELPVGEVLPKLARALQQHRVAVLQAPPGAGKTTLVPLYLLQETKAGKILMLEPRRLAARAAAQRLAEHLGTPLGGLVGYRMRGDVKSGPDTRIEVVTEGILTRMIQSDPELSGVDTIIFDEFHERSLQADLGLALALEIKAALREDLRLLVMSATLAADPVAALLGNAPIVTSTGRSFPVETRFADKSWRGPNQRYDAFERAIVESVTEALATHAGGLLVFLPGAGEIHRVANLLAPTLASDVHLHKLFGALDFKTQQAAIRPEASGRKLVLATSIAETSLTIDDITVVIDGGLTRRALFDVSSGMARLTTDRVTQAEATQRQGRAGRLAPGVCYKHWTRGEDGALAAFPRPEIQSTDLVPLALEAALWGAKPEDLPFLDPPPGPAIGEAYRLLAELEAVDAAQRITAHGKVLAGMPLHPRLAHMVAKGGPDGAMIAALLSEQDILRVPGNSATTVLQLRLDAAANSKKFQRDTGLKVHSARLDRVRSDHKRIARFAKANELGPAATVALAYPDRIAKRRKGDAPRYLLSGGKGAIIAADDPAANEPYLVAIDLDGDPSQARIRLAAPISEAEIRAVFASSIKSVCRATWSSRDKKVQALCREELGAIELSEQTWRDAPDAEITDALLSGIRELGLDCLPWSEAALQWRARANWLRDSDPALPDMTDAALLTRLDDWLPAILKRQKRPGEIAPGALFDALKNSLPWEVLQSIERLAPAAITAPTGTKLVIDYSQATPTIRVRLQEMFGLSAHPVIGPHKTPLVVELLSPARRPVQTTSDLPGFWATSYEDVRKDLRGRYPKHFWPENPSIATPTSRTKPRPQK